MSNTILLPLRVTIKRFGAPLATERTVQVDADPNWTLLDLLLNLSPTNQSPVEVRWQFQIGEQTLASTERVRDVCDRYRDSEHWVDGVLWLELCFISDVVLNNDFEVREQVSQNESTGEFKLPDAPAPFALPGAPPGAGAAPGSAKPAPPRPAPDRAASAEPVPAKRKANVREESSDAAVAAPRRTERRATVRYYTRMNPDRMFPLLVILSAEEVAEIVKAKVKQAASEKFEVDEGSVVEVEPVLPGCDCYPPRHALTIDADGASSATIWVVPKVLGRVHGARVVIRQGAKVLAEVPLEVKVAKQTLAVACGLLSLAAPYLTMGLKSLKLDYASQQAEGFPIYQQAGSWLAENLRPEWLGLGFLGLAVALYFWMRPRRRDVFWDVNPK